MCLACLVSVQNPMVMLACSQSSFGDEAMQKLLVRTVPGSHSQQATSDQQPCAGCQLCPGVAPAARACNLLQMRQGVSCPSRPPRAHAVTFQTARLWISCALM